MTNQNMVNVNSGGISATLDFGPNSQAIAQGAYSFLNTSMAMDNAFLLSATNSAQSFYSGLVMPSTTAAAAQVEQNTAMLPQLYEMLFSTNTKAMDATERLTNSSIAAQQNIATASINASSRIARNTGKRSGFAGCFITTAYCEYAGLPDDCHELQTLRKFRDEFMMSNTVCASLVAFYYEHAPGIVARISQHPNRSAILERVKTHVNYCLALIAQDKNWEAVTAYMEMVVNIEAQTHVG
jgi:hypothetical protein